MLKRTGALRWESRCLQGGPCLQGDTAALAQIRRHGLRAVAHHRDGALPVGPPRHEPPASTGTGQCMCAMGLGQMQGHARTSQAPPVCDAAAGDALQGRAADGIADLAAPAAHR